MQNLTMSLEEEEYDGTGDEEGSESDYSEGHVSQLRFLSGKKRKNDFEEVVNASIEPPPPLPQNYEARDFRQLTQPDRKDYLSTSVATTSARVGFKCRSVLVKLREIYVILIEYHCYEYCQIGHHILIDNRLDDFWPRMSAWQIKRRKVTGNKAKHHLALMRQQLDLRTINNMQWDPFRNMKNALKREVIIVDNISRKRIFLQCPFGGYEWYLGDRCWAQLEHRAMSYDLPEKLHCFPSSDVVRSLRAAGWIEAQHYIVGHHIDYDAYWRHVSHGALMSDITRGLKSNGKMKWELLKRGLHVGGIYGGGVRGEGHLKAVLDAFIDSSSEEEENIEQSSTDYSDDDVIDEIKMEILRNQDEIEELEEAKSSRTCVGSVVRHKTINRSRVLWNNTFDTAGTFRLLIRDKNGESSLELNGVSGVAGVDVPGLEFDVCFIRTLRANVSGCWSCNIFQH
ncbi:hypothetical protein GIB67_016199 [Kingdonia uniflora]|uniref:Uncharacterized protein n=1 Tax=Kingdonia uniflora TaxID=39325 RepID=A0A7J7LTA1_9MAGN|nr:hypothetical protein GIB67_016199 [Kingdonia uniflora]